VKTALHDDRSFTQPPSKGLEHADGKAWRYGPADRIGLPAVCCVLLRRLAPIVFCAANGARPLLITAAAFFPVGIVHGVGVWFGGW